MSSRIDLSTAGVTLSYVAETTAGTRPTTGYVQLKGVKEIPEMNPAPDTLETTTLDETEYKTYIDGLKDLGGALGFTFNLTQEFVTDWETCVSAYDTAETNNKNMWFCVSIPGIAKALFFQGKPSPLGLPGISVNAVLEVTAYITPTGAPEWQTKPTAATS